MIGCTHVILCPNSLVVSFRGCFAGGPCPGSARRDDCFQEVELSRKLCPAWRIALSLAELSAKEPSAQTPFVSQACGVGGGEDRSAFGKCVDRFAEGIAAERNQPEQSSSQLPRASKKRSGGQRGRASAGEDRDQEAQTRLCLEEA